VIWKSNLSRELKIRLFTGIVESVLLYGCETWSINKTVEKKIDGVYTRLLRTALNISWRDHITNAVVYGKLPKVSSKVRERRMRLAGHCVRHEDEPASKLILWQPTRGWANRGRKKTTYIDTLLNDTDLATTAELQTVMNDRTEWRKRIHRVRAVARPK